MKCQIFFSRKNKKNVISLLSVGVAHSAVSVNSAGFISLLSNL